MSPAILAIAIAILVIELAVTAGARGLVGGPLGIGWRANLIEQFAVSDRLFEWMWATGNWSLPDLARFVAYAFVHVSFSQAVFAAVFVLALGKFVGDVAGGLRATVIFLGSAIVGALVYVLVVQDAGFLTGGFPGAYGLIGAFSYVLMTRLEQMGGNQLQAFQLLGILMAIQLGFGLIFGGPPHWIADLAGAGAGFALMALMQPGALVGWIRRR